MDPRGTWRVNAAGPFGRFAFDLDIADAGGVLGVRARYGDQRFDTRGLQVLTDGDGYRVRGSHRLVTPVRITVTLDAVLQGDLLRGSATAGFLPRSRLEGYRVSGGPAAGAGQPGS